MSLKLFAFLFAICVVMAAGAAVDQRSRLGGNLKPFKTSEERIRSHGYPAETHFVETSAGYVLQLFRLPYSPKLGNQNKYRPAILLQHGLLSNSDCWLSNGPDNSLAYILADAGYDVWLGNARGNIYSRSNTKVSLNHPKFWHFSWHEIAVVDIAEMIDYILDITGQTALHYAGHSQGTTVYFVLMSERPEHNAKIKSAHMLAPCAFFAHGKSPVFELLAPVVGTPAGIWYSLLSDLELLPQNTLLNRLVDSTCGPKDKEQPRCKNFYLWAVGDGLQNTNVTALQVLLETHPAGSSSNQGIHYIQSYLSHEFRRYDFGEKENQRVYNQAVPQDYDLSKITAPTYLYSSENDALCVPADVNTLVSKLPNLAGDYRIPVPSWNHLDFIVANDMRKVVNDRVVKTCNEHEGTF